MCDGIYDVFPEPRGGMMPRYTLELPGPFPWRSPEGADPVEDIKTMAAMDRRNVRGPWADVLPPDCWICGREVYASPRVVHRQCEEGRLAALEDAQKKAVDVDQVRSLALTARAIGIAMQPDGDGWPKGVLPQKDRDALVKAADLVLEDLGDIGPAFVMHEEAPAAAPKVVECPRCRAWHLAPLCEAPPAAR